ncbi:MAG: VWA domain-containing protein, partial [Sciscionella sp.]
MNPLEVERGTPAGLTARLTQFIHALRGRGIQLGPGESIDAAAALRVLGLDDRERVREGLAATMIRRDGQRAVFDALFDLYFPLGVGTNERARYSVRDGDERNRLREAMVEALATGQDNELAALAGEAVDALGATGSGAAGTWSAHHTLDRLQPETLLVQTLAAMRAGRATVEPEFTDRLDREEIRRRIEDFRQHVRGEARRRVAELRGRERITEHAVVPTADQLDFLRAGMAELAMLRRTVQPLARKLATRLAVRRKHASRGAINLRLTLRRSLSTGGVPMRPAYRRRRPHRPEIVLLCDLSGSVASFADFTLSLVRALREEFSKVRVFAFVDSIDEVTELVTGGDDGAAGLASRILQTAAVSRWDGHSDYRHVLEQFTERYL